MLKKMSIRKIMVATLTLFVLLLIYIIPSNKEETVQVKQKLEYIYPNNLQVIYLLDNNDYVARTSIVGINTENLIAKSKDLIEGLTVDGTKSNTIPNGFKQIIPSGTKINDIKLEDKILKIDFSKEILEINEKYEEKMIEALTYTLTSLKGIDGIIIYVEGELLTKLPKSNKHLPTFLNKSYGINKIYDISHTSDIDSYTVFYVKQYNDNNYYVPVTKYINSDSQDKIKVIIEQLTSAPTYESNLMSYLNVNTKLLNYELEENKIKLNFNNLILSDITNKSILEEVVYTISLSVDNALEIEEVIFQVDEEEILKKSIKDIE